MDESKKDLIYHLNESVVISSGEDLAARGLGDLARLAKITTPNAARGQSPEEQYRCGKSCAELEDYVQAAEWYRKAADRGHVVAQNYLGILYEKGQGVPQDYAQAASWFHKAAEGGHAGAQFNLAVLYGAGAGVSEDEAQEIFWLRKAADQGQADAQTTLGYCYAKGLGVPQDYAQALSWLQQAAEQGNADAQYQLGCHYANGQVVPRDDVVAYALFNLSATNYVSQYSHATYNRDALADKMTLQQIDAGQELTRRMQLVGILEAINSRP